MLTGLVFSCGICSNFIYCVTIFLRIVKITNLKIDDKFVLNFNSRFKLKMLLKRSH